MAKAHLAADKIPDDLLASTNAALTAAERLCGLWVSIDRAVSTQARDPQHEDLISYYAAAFLAHKSARDCLNDAGWKVFHESTAIEYAAASDSNARWEHWSPRTARFDSRQNRDWDECGSCHEMVYRWLKRLPTAPQIEGDEVTHTFARDNFDALKSAVSKQFGDEFRLIPLMVALKRELSRAVINRQRAEERTQRPDGPFEPDGFRLDGKETRLQPLTWKVVNSLWFASQRTMNDLALVEEVWGVGYEEKAGEALKQQIKKASAAFVDKKINASVFRIKGTTKVTLEIGSK